MHQIDVECVNCMSTLSVNIESEDMGEGSEHRIKCDGCGMTTVFNIAYVPVSDDERLAGEG